MKKASKKDLEKVHLEAKKRFDVAEEFEREDRILMEEDFCFAAGQQWPSEVEAQRQSDGRPCLTINRLPQFISQVVGDARQNKPSIKTHGVDDQSDPETAEVIEGLIRHIESYSQATTAYLTAFEHAVTGGKGAWRIVTKRDHKDPFVQDIHVERIISPFAVYTDPNAKRYDKTDAKWKFVVEWITEEAFESRYPKDSPADWEQEFKRNECSNWRQGDRVRLAEYWCKKDRIKNIALMADGRRVVWEELDQSEYGDVLDVAETKSFDVVRYVMSGHKVLEGPDVFPGEFIPIIEVFGPEELIDNRTRTRSLIRYAKDAQRQYNYWQSTITEKVALAPKAPFIGTIEQFKGLENFWMGANTENRAYLPYNPDPKAPGPPIRIAPAAINAAELQQSAQAVDDLKATMGIYDASLGGRTNETSGRAIIARQRQGDVSTYAWVDNLARSIELTGKILIGIIPATYDTRRVVRILGQDDSSKTVVINEPGMMKDGTPGLLNDLTRGKYDITVTVGPSYATKRLEAAESMMAFMQAFPQAAQVAGDLVARAMDWPGAEEIGDRLEKALPPGFVDKEMTEEEAMAARDQAQALQQEEDFMKGLAIKEKQTEIFAKNSKGMKDLSEAEAQDIENDAVQSGLMELAGG